MAAVVFVILFIVFIRFQPLAFRVIRFMKRLPLLNKIGAQIDAFYNSSYQLLETKTLLYSILLGIISWAFEGIVIYLTLMAFGFPISILSSVFIVAFASIAGALSMLP